jgi:hypothetical protein
MTLTNGAQSNNIFWSTLAPSYATFVYTSPGPFYGTFLSYDSLSFDNSFQRLNGHAYSIDLGVTFNGAAIVDTINKTSSVNPPPPPPPAPATSGSGESHQTTRNILLFLAGAFVLYLLFTMYTNYKA